VALNSLDADDLQSIDVFEIVTKDLLSDFWLGESKDQVSSGTIALDTLCNTARQEVLMLIPGHTHSLALDVQVVSLGVE